MVLLFDIILPAFSRTYNSLDLVVFLTFAKASMIYNLWAVFICFIYYYRDFRNFMFFLSCHFNWFSFFLTKRLRDLYWGCLFNDPCFLKFPLPALSKVSYGMTIIHNISLWIVYSFWPADFCCLELGHVSSNFVWTCSVDLFNMK